MLEDQPGMDPKRAQEYTKAAGMRTESDYLKELDTRSKIKRREAITSHEKVMEGIGLRKMSLAESKDPKDRAMKKSGMQYDIDRLISKEEENILDIKKQIAKLEEPEVDAFGNEKPMTLETKGMISELRADIKNTKTRIKDYEYEKTVIGKIPNEYEAHGLSREEFQKGGLKTELSHPRHYAGDREGGATPPPQPKPAPAPAPPPAPAKTEMPTAESAKKKKPLVKRTKADAIKHIQKSFYSKPNIEQKAKEAGFKTLDEYVKSMTNKYLAYLKREGALLDGK